ncbi:MAG TPA: flagellar basal-body rod protein FlgG [Xanthobacteraceae bacterium]|jgi:flagellar basal-body rod protein FlgG|nr:flagellar basal-body rod protein FlgG [Xanthobacteraceae bacterium]
MRALYTAASGMAAQETAVQVISNNIANLRTTGYKKQRAEFEDLLYEHVRRVGTQTTDQGNVLPVGVDIGTGVKTVATPRMMGPGSPSQTGNPLDLMIRGDGFFKIQMPDGTFAYTRDGSFNLDGQGRLVTNSGNLVQPGITFPANASQISVNQNGQVSVVLPGQTNPTIVGQLDVTRFINPVGLQPVGDNLYVETPASGAAQDGVPNTNGAGNILQGNLEAANVDAVTEISDLISAQRAYEMNSKVVSASDQMLQAVSNLSR